MVVTLALTSSLQAQPPSATDPALRGVVVEATTGVPLRRARITAGTETLVFTDDQGQFTLVTMPSGAGTLRVTKAEGPALDRPRRRSRIHHARRSGR